MMVIDACVRSNHITHTTSNVRSQRPVVNTYTGSIAIVWQVRTEWRLSPCRGNNDFDSCWLYNWILGIACFSLVTGATDWAKTTWHGVTDLEQTIDQNGINWSASSIWENATTPEPDTILSLRNDSKTDFFFTLSVNPTFFFFFFFGGGGVGALFLTLKKLILYTYAKKRYNNNNTNLTLSAGGVSRW